MPTETEAGTGSFDRDALADKISDQFDAAFASVNEADLLEDETTPAKETPEEKPAAEAKVEETDAAVEEEQTETPAEEAAATVEAPKPAATAPTLPAAYVRSLKAYEWTDEEIAEAAKNPSFITTAAKLHQTRVKEVAEWAKLGRESKTQQQPAAQAQQDKKPLDIDALRKQYGDEPLIDVLAAQLEEMKVMKTFVEQQQRSAAASQLETLGRQIEGFFSGKDMEPYKDQYGSGANASQEQLASRQKVLELADALIGGARMQGRSLSLDEALTLAHDSVSAPVKEQAARKKIVAAVQQRQRGITLKPGSQTPAPAGKSSRNDLEKNVKKGLAALYG